LKDSSGKGASVSAGALLGESGVGLLCWGSGMMCGRGLRGRPSLSAGAPLGILEGSSFAGDLCVEEGSRDGHSSP